MEWIEDADARSDALDAKGHGDGTGDAAGDDVRGDHRQGCGQGIGDSRLGGDGCADNERRDCGVALGLREELRTDPGSDGSGHRRKDRHDAYDAVPVVHAGAQQGEGEEPSGLVDRAAHVEGEHGAYQEGGDELHRARDGAQQADEGVHKPGHGRADDIVRAQSKDKERHDRDDQEAEQGLEVLAQVDLFHRLDEIADCKADHAGAQEACADLGAEQVGTVGEVTADEGRHDGGLITDGVGDEGAHHRDHEREAQAADGIEHPSERSHLAEIAGVDREIVKQERQRDQDAAADDKRQGRGDAGHEVAHDAGGDALLLGAELDRGSLEDLGFTLKVAHKAVDALEGLGNGHFNDLLAVEANTIVIAHAATEREDDVVGLLDLLGRKLVLDAAGTLGLDVNLITQLGALRLDRLGHHVGVCNAGRAVGDGHD